MDKNRVIARVANEPFRIVEWLSETYPDVLDEYYQEHCLPTKQEQAQAFARAVDALTAAGLGDNEGVAKLRNELVKAREDVAAEQAAGAMRAVRK